MLKHFLVQVPPQSQTKPVPKCPLKILFSVSSLTLTRGKVERQTQQSKDPEDDSREVEEVLEWVQEGVKERG